MNLLKKSFSLSSRDKLQLYKSIREIPAVNFYDVVEKNDYTYVMKKRRKATDKELVLCQQRFLELFDEKIKEFGLPKNVEEYFKLKKKAIIALCDSIISGDRFLETKADLMDLKMSELVPASQVMKFRNVMSQLNKLGYSTSIKMSLYEYESIVETVGNG